MSVHPTPVYTSLRYYGNRSTLEVHHVSTQTAECRLVDIDDGVRFFPDTLKEARKNGYGLCQRCSGSGT